MAHFSSRQLPFALTGINILTPALTALLLIIFTFSPAYATQLRDTSAAAKSILIVGDSLSASYGMNETLGWVSLLQQRLNTTEHEYQLINASVSGETTSGGLRRIDALLKKWQPELVVLELGGNDGLRGASLKTIQSNLSAMIEQAKTTQAEVILLGIKIPPNYGPRYTDAFHQIYFTLAQEHSISLVPFLLQNVATRNTLMQADGVHPTAEAQPLILENVWNILSKHL